MEHPAIEILPYDVSPPTCAPQDRDAAAAAAILVKFVGNQLPGVIVEHIGSTAVSGCSGKGILDLMLVCRGEELAATRDRIDALGFQRQTTRDPFPEERPMRTGSFEFQGKRHLVHVHILSADSQEVEDMRYFRDCLRADPELKSAYVAFKKKILGSGVTDSIDYAVAKGEFIRQCLGR